MRLVGTSGGLSNLEIIISSPAPSSLIKAVSIFPVAPLFKAQKHGKSIDMAMAKIALKRQE